MKSTVYLLHAAANVIESAKINDELLSFVGFLSMSDNRKINVKVPNDHVEARGDANIFRTETDSLKMEKL